MTVRSGRRSTSTWIWRRRHQRTVIKGIVFGGAISLMAVFEGFYAQPTAEGVSNATTRTVVNSALAVLAFDYLLTSIDFFTEPKSCARHAR